MKRFVLLFSSVLAVMGASAQLNGDGYYRVQNAVTERYATMVDYHGSVNIAATTADLSAIQNVKGFENVVSNPASVIYIEKVGSQYNLKAQGADASSIISVDGTPLYLNITEADTRVAGAVAGSYHASGSYMGMSMRLCDNVTVTDSVTSMLSTSQNSKGQYWFIKPVTTDGEEYFGIRPTITVGSDHYAAFFASFPIQLTSKGMKAYVVDAYGRGGARWRELTDGVVPSATPVIIRCASTEPSANRVTILTTEPAKVSGNLLSGNYFCNHATNHVARLEYNANSMRVLGVAHTGELALLKGDASLLVENEGHYYLPANTAYLPVSSAQTELILRDAEAYEAAGISEVRMDNGVARQGVYTLQGVRIGAAGATLEGLRPGVYIVDGKKTVVK